MTHQQWLEEPYENDDRQQRADDELHEIEWKRCVDDTDPMLHPTVLIEYCGYFNEHFRDNPMTYNEWVGDQSPIDILAYCLKYYHDSENDMP